MTDDATLSAVLHCGDLERGERENDESVNLEGDSKRGRVLDRVGAGAEAGFEFRRTGAESAGSICGLTPPCGVTSRTFCPFLARALFCAAADMGFCCFALFLGKFSLSENRKDQYDNNTITVMGERNLTHKC